MIPFRNLIRSSQSYDCWKHLTLQIPNSLGDKFSHGDSQNETRITNYEKKKTETMLNVSYFEKAMSH